MPSPGGKAMNLPEPGATRVDQWCVDYDAGANAYLVSMEGFAYREAS